MLTSLALIFLLGLLLGQLFRKLKLPALLGMLVTGMLLGPYALNQIHPSILSISPDLRTLALVIILTRAGLSLDIQQLKKVGRPAILMCFVPASFEIAAMVWLGPALLGISVLDAALAGSVIAAVSPAVVVPRMIHLLEKGYGTDKSIPQLIMAGASVDDVFVIVLFSSFLGLSSHGQVSALQFLAIPLAFLTGILLGGAAGYLLSRLFLRFHMRDSAKVLILLSLSFLFLGLEQRIKSLVPFSGLLAVMAQGIVLLRCHPTCAQRLSAKFSKLWVAAEILLFVLVGATVDLQYAKAAGPKMVLLLLAVLAFRMLGVLVSLLGTALNQKERLFCALAYIPKATVQAAIGGVPLAMGLASGNLILTLAVLSILLMAPLGAVAIDSLYAKLLHRT